MHPANETMGWFKGSKQRIAMMHWYSPYVPSLTLRPSSHWVNRSRVIYFYQWIFWSSSKISSSAATGTLIENVQSLKTSTDLDFRVRAMHNGRGNVTSLKNLTNDLCNYLTTSEDPWLCHWPFDIYATKVKHTSHIQEPSSRYPSHVKSSYTSFDEKGLAEMRRWMISVLRGSVTLFTKWMLLEWLSCVVCERFDSWSRLHICLTSCSTHILTPHCNPPFY